jgi:alcohol dehydrogenase class IV
MYLPRTIIHGGGSIRRLGALLGDMGLKRPLVVADKFLASPQSGAVDKVCDSLSASGAPFEVFTDTIPDPTTESVERCVDALAAGNFDSIVALGGGSPMDTAKAAAVLFKQGGRMRDYKAPFQNDGATLPMIAIPTTAGTGSEATKFTIVTDSETQEKMLCAGPPPPLPAPTAGQPRQLVTSALSHAGARAWRTCPSRPSSTTSSR